MGAAIGRVILGAGARGGARGAGRGGVLAGPGMACWVPAEGERRPGRDLPPRPDDLITLGCTTSEPSTARSRA
jgi:hypothetical protein